MKGLKDMMGFGTRKKTEVTPAVIEPTIQEQLATALATVEECDAKIKRHDEEHLKFVREHGVISTGDDITNPIITPQQPAALSDDNLAEIMQEGHSYKLQRNHLVYEFSAALSVWADLKLRLNTQQGRQ